MKIKTILKQKKKKTHRPTSKNYLLEYCEPNEIFSDVTDLTRYNTRRPDFSVNSLNSIGVLK